MLVSRNVTVGALRTSMRLEPEFWAALADIARTEDLSLDALCSLIDARRGAVSRTAAMRLFATAYFAGAGTDADISAIVEPDEATQPQYMRSLRVASR